jgi:hypothetical protein
MTRVGALRQRWLCDAANKLVYGGFGGITRYTDLFRVDQKYPLTFQRFDLSVRWLSTGVTDQPPATQTQRHVSHPRSIAGETNNDLGLRLACVSDAVKSQRVTPRAT